MYRRKRSAVAKRKGTDEDEGVFEEKRAARDSSIPLPSTLPPTPGNLLRSRHSLPTTGLEVANAEGETPLHLHQCRETLAEALLDAGANPEAPTRRATPCISPREPRNDVVARARSRVP
jgi:hypothetical protein